MLAWKHARVVSILKPGKDPTVSSPYWLISLLGTAGKPFEKILLARFLLEVNERVVLLDKQFGIRPRHSTMLYLARLVETVNNVIFGGGYQSGFPGCGYSFRYRMCHRHTLQANRPKLSISPGENVDCRRSKLPSSQPHLHVMACGQVWRTGDSSPRCCSACM
jgi:hypothetical protein